MQLRKYVWHLRRSSATIILDLARVTQVKLGCNKLFHNRKSAFYMQLWDDIRRCVLRKSVSNYSVVGASVRGRPVRVPGVLGLSQFNFCAVVRSVADVKFYFSMLSLAVVSTTAINTRRRVLGDVFGRIYCVILSGFSIAAYELANSSQDLEVADDNLYNVQMVYVRVQECSLLSVFFLVVVVLVVPFRGLVGVCGAATRVTPILLLILSRKILKN